MITSEQKTAIKYIVTMLIVLLLVTLVWALLGNRDSTSLREVIRTDSGVDVETRKSVILKMVSRGSDRLTQEEKRSIMRAISGNNVNLYGFTDEEIDDIYTVINN